MSKKPDSFVRLSPTLHLCGFIDGGSKGYWLYDETRGMNLAMRAETERAAFVEALTYYQKRFTALDRAHNDLCDSVQSFVARHTEEVTE